MVLYRGKYELDGLAAISPEMEKDLDMAYGICQSLRDELPCEMCGRCCHQPNIIVRPEEVDRVATAAGVDLYVPNFSANQLERRMVGAKMRGVV